MSWQVAIPSHGRADVVGRKTLAMLRHGGVPAERISVWVQPGEMLEYQAALEHLGVAVRKGAPGLCGQRLAIAQGYEPGTHVLHVDDDLTAVVERGPDGKLAPVRNLRNLIAQGFEAMTAGHACLWGLYPVANARWLRPGVVRRGLWFIYGCWWGQLVTEDPRRWRVTHALTEDYERTCRSYLADGRVVRLEGYAPRQSYMSGAGGLTAARNGPARQAAVQHVLDAFPGLAHPGKTRTFQGVPWPELRLKDTR